MILDRSVLRMAGETRKECEVRGVPMTIRTCSPLVPMSTLEDPEVLLVMSKY